MLVKQKKEVYLTTSNSFRHKKEVMKKYNITSRNYDELYGEEQRSKYKLAFMRIKHLKGIVLDAGCGTALLYRFLNKKALRRLKLYVGVDLSDGMLRKAKDKVFRENIPAELIRADVDFLPFRAKVFDAVFAFTLLQNMPEPAVTCRELIRVIKDYGVLVISIPRNVNVNVDLQGEILEDGNVKDIIFLLKLNNKPNT
ncbi:MAG: hypothetical protein DRO23_10250 [Thermoprotei archaeon]|nr:MAG: hypothetical protein DRO23_10250 [Thermoprotei archaeon]